MSENGTVNIEFESPAIGVTPIGEMSDREIMVELLIYMRSFRVAMDEVSKNPMLGSMMKMFGNGK